MGDSRARKIKGTWEIIRGDWIVNFKGESRSGSNQYGYKTNKKGYERVIAFHDDNANNKRDKGEGIIAKFKADSNVMRRHDYDSIEKGKFVVNVDSGRFRLFDNGEMFGVGKVVDMDYIFGELSPNY